jgi:hypothetical protein
MPYSAKMAALVLAEKARLYGEDKAVERWNGKGKAIEDTGYGSEYADARNHVSKINEMNKMLAHPLNSNIANAYKRYLLE